MSNNDGLVQELVRINNILKSMHGNYTDYTDDIKFPSANNELQIMESHIKAIHAGLESYSRSLDSILEKNYKCSANIKNTIEKCVELIKKIEAKQKSATNQLHLILIDVKGSVGAFLKRYAMGNVWFSKIWTSVKKD